VDWYPWGPEAFEKARKENKLIFLSIGYSSCYWCHVMERQSFANPEIAKLMNERFVCIKVDREERPDVDSIYMTALHIQGSRGGWPLSMFLLPDGKPIGGGTYWPPEDRDVDGEKVYGFKSILKLLHDDWVKQPDKLQDLAARMADAVKAETAGMGKKSVLVALDDELLQEAVKEVQDSFDPEHAGFGSKARQFRGPKFPQPTLPEFLLAAHHRKRDETSLKMVNQTLDRMARGGIYDHLGGGFHRYSVDRAWKVPHFEKMLYDNAQLVSLYSRVYSLGRDPAHERVVRETMDFVVRELTSPQGGFYSALDAETEGEEGKYYVWTAAEIDKLLPAADAELVKRVYGVSEGPNFEEKFNVLLLPRSLEQTAGDLGMSERDLLARLQPLKQKLFAARSQRPRPLLDTKILTGWNGLMIMGCADAAMAFEDPAYAALGERAADFILKNLRSADGRLLRTCTLMPDGRPDSKLNAYLEDYAAMVCALAALHDATGKQRWLDEARRLADAMLEHYADKEAGGFFFTSHDHEKLFARAKDQYDGATPSGNSLAALGLTKLAAKTGEAKYRLAAEGTFKSTGELLKTGPGSATTMLRALALWLEPQDKGVKERSLDGPFKSKEDSARTMEPVKASAAFKSQKVEGDGRSALTLEVTLDIEKGWHVYANPAGEGSLIPTTVTVSAANKPEDVKVVFPAGKAKKDDVLGETIYLYEGRVVIPVSLRRPAVDGKPDNSALEVTVRFQACSDSQCLAPKTVKLKVEPR
jgi:uncharacterized protein YyaL (SSP411 family)